MDDLSLEAFEARAAAAEQKLAALEISSGSSQSATDLSTLRSIRAALVRAKEEQENLILENKKLLSQRDKLEYQLLHLKKAVREGDAKLEQLTKQP
ncbi:hypothetical protein COCOBI_09-1330 [Coccomyxa sp. Obi]|nr:hypothetical protein COCOBI_09-1330 [Coccomyxa sp. Obi]